MLIVEGPDRVGKTTLCHKLVSLLNDRGRPHVYQHMTKLAPCFDTLLGYGPLMAPDLVMDRFHVSRQAYGEVFENQPTLDNQQLELLEAELALVGAFVVVVTDAGGVIESAEWDQDQMYERDGVLKVNEVYRRIVKKRECRVHMHLEVSAEEGLWPSGAARAVVSAYDKRRMRYEAILHQATSNGSIRGRAGGALNG